MSTPASKEEKPIEQQSGNQMNDLEYSRKRLVPLKMGIIDLWMTSCEALSLGRQPGNTLNSLSQVWTDALLALCAAGTTRSFALPASKEQASGRRNGLRETGVR